MQKFFFITTFVLSLLCFGCKTNTQNNNDLPDLPDVNDVTKDSNKVEDETASPLTTHKEIQANTDYKLQIGDQVIVVPKGSIVKVDTKTYKNAEGHGANIETSSDQVAQNMNAEPPAINIDGSTSTGGGYKLSNKLTKLSTKTNMLLVMGGVLAVAGIIVMVWVNKIKGFMMTGGGICIAAVGFVMETFPIAILLVVLVAVGGVGYLVYDLYKNEKQKKALTGIVKGIAKANGGAEPIKKSIASQDYDGTIKKQVTKIKDKEKLE